MQNPATKERLMLSVAEAAKLSGIGKNHLYDLCHSKGFPVYRVGKKFYIHCEKFIRWVDEQVECGRV